ncbi:MAG: hypothetical protein SynsKO_22360 [Synoicihabitans sp.]
MSLQRHIYCLVTWLVLSALLAAFIANQAESDEYEQLRRSSQSHLRNDSAHWIELAGVGMQRFVEDYSWWDEMVEFANTPDPDWAYTNFVDSLEFWEVSGVWVFDRNGDRSYELVAESYPELSFPLDKGEILQAIRIQPFAHFFRATPEGWLELRSAPIQSGDDEERSSPAQGWFFVGRIWDEEHFNRLRPSDIFEMEITASNGAPPSAEFSPGVSVTHSLRDERGAKVAEFRVGRTSHELDLWAEAGIDETLLWILFGGINAIVLWIWLHLLITKPVRTLAEGLNRHDISKIAQISRKNNELGNIARRVGADLQQQDLLRKETERRRSTEVALRKSEISLKNAIKERSQLQLDLHDSTIQVLYASGMSLSAIEKDLGDIAPESRERIQNIRRHLQIAVDDLRGFIADSAPEEAKSSLNESIEELLALMRSSNRVEVVSEIDTGAENALSESDTIELLQILREATSNAMRHARAKTIWVRLKVRPSFVRLTIEDDGIGVPEEERKQPSRGLKNMQSRALSIGAELVVEDRLEGGTRVDLKFI